MMSSYSLRLTLACLTACACGTASVADDWKPRPGPLTTPWTADVSPANALPEYPRPQMVRPAWMNLNGLWDYAVVAADVEHPEGYEGKILVPFPIESSLSGVMRQVKPEERLWYRRTFTLPADWDGKRVLLHFGAVDWEAVVWVNGKEVGGHRGGYDPFSLDVTDALKSDGEQEIIVRVFDPTDQGYQPRGKQVLNPHGIWYTPVTGIWQTTWLEAVPRSYVESFRVVPDIDDDRAIFMVNAAGDETSAEVKVEAMVDGESVGAATGKLGEPITLPIEEPRLWSPDDPFLYDLKISLVKDGEAVDEVTGYFGMRKISLLKDKNGVLRLGLNNKPLFQYGPLDQGFWPDGIYTAPTDDALRFDVEVTKKLGMNMLRKHVKVEPARWYYWCDKLGLLVWQDMPSGDKYIGRNDPDIERTEESARQFIEEWGGIIGANFNSPAIVMWVPFNEGWGQFATERIVRWTKETDPTRLVNNASGWTDRQCGDVMDIHAYPGPAMPALEETRAAVLGEFGGLGLPIKGHTWQDSKNWGYRSYETLEALQDAYLNLIARLKLLIGQGLAAAVYTQTTDVEIEVNGLITYDRRIIKMDPEVVGPVNEDLLGPVPSVRVVVPRALAKEGGWDRPEPPVWRYTTEKPAEGWEKADFDDSGWKDGPAGFGTEGTPGAIIGTKWDTPEIWIRRTFDWKDDAAGELALEVHHDEDAEVHLNGTLVAKLEGFTTSYVFVPLTAEHRDVLTKGSNTIAIHCKQTRGGQYIDLGIVALEREDDD